MDSDEQTRLKNFPQRVSEAMARIKPYVFKTPLIRSPYLSEHADVYLKLESEQLTGSFKLRGACNKMLKLKETDHDTLRKGVTTASTGNHGLACVQASKLCGCSLEIFAREGISPAKKETLEKHGANITIHGQDCVEAELLARKTAEERGITYVSPYNDWDVAAGQGTIGVEICELLADVDVVFASVGGGGLIGGIAAYMKSQNPNIKIVGCQPQNSKVMYECVKAGKIVHEESLDTLSEGTVGDVEDDTITFPLCRNNVDDWVLVDEQSIEDALYLMVDKEHKLMEGAAALAVAAFLQTADQYKGKKVVLIICGANVGTPDLLRILNDHRNK